jgi:alkylhydroperoxidase/carboxymuconolactone decarboxylase family protein YurZ
MSRPSHSSSRTSPAPGSATRELLRRLATGDEAALEAAVSSQPGRQGAGRKLDRSTRVLVELAALLATDAPTTSVRWAAERAAAAGADDAALVGVLLAAGAAAGEAQMVTSAPRLALALDVDVEVFGWDGD